jgi:hypothetical protein
MYSISHSLTEGPQTGLALWCFEEVLMLPMICWLFECFMEKCLVSKLVVCLMVEVALFFFSPTSLGEVAALSPREESECEGSPL